MSSGILAFISRLLFGMASSTPTEADKALLKAKKDLEETRKELADERQTKRGEK